MKNLLYRLSFLVFASLIFVSCEENEIPQIDVQNARAIASFNGAASQSAIFDPSQETETTFRVGVSTISDQDRTVQITVGDGSTLDPSYYSIDNLSPVIPAGEFTTEFTVTTIPGASLPSASSVLVLNLQSIENAEILDESIDALTIGLEVKCPSVDTSLIPGSYDVTALTFFGFFQETEVTREVVAGPGENQFTIVGGSYPGSGATDLIFTVDPETGSVTAIDETEFAYNGAAYGPNTYLFKPGGRVLTCAGIIEINFDFGGAIQGNPNSFKLIKQ